MLDCAPGEHPVGMAPRVPCSRRGALPSPRAGQGDILLQGTTTSSLRPALAEFRGCTGGGTMSCAILSRKYYTLSRKYLHVQKVVVLRQKAKAPVVLLLAAAAAASLKND